MKMAYVDKNINSDRFCPKMTSNQDEYWTGPKRRLFEMIIEESLSRKEVAQRINKSTRTIQRWIKDPSFQEALTQSSDTWQMRITAWRLHAIHKLLQRLSKRAKKSIKEVSPNVLISEYRKLLVGKPSQILPAIFQQDTFPKKGVFPSVVSLKATKFIEEAVLKEQGFRPLKVSIKEIEEIQKGKSDK